MINYAQRNKVRARERQKEELRGMKYKRKDRKKSSKNGVKEKEETEKEGKQVKWEWKRGKLKEWKRDKRIQGNYTSKWKHKNE